MRILKNHEIANIAGGEYEDGKYIMMGASTGLVIGSMLSVIGIKNWLKGGMGSDPSLIEVLGSAFLFGQIIGLSMGTYQEIQMQNVSEMVITEII